MILKDGSIDPVELGIRMAALDRDMSELKKWQRKNWSYTKSMHKKIKVMSLTLRRHRLVFGGIWSFVYLSSLLAWELSKDWIRIKFQLIMGG